MSQIRVSIKKKKFKRKSKCKPTNTSDIPVRSMKYIMRVKVIPLNALTSIHLFVNTLPFGTSVFSSFWNSHIVHLYSPLSKVFIIGLHEKKRETKCRIFQNQ